MLHKPYRIGHCKFMLLTHLYRKILELFLEKSGYRIYIFIQ